MRVPSGVAPSRPELLGECVGDRLIGPRLWAPHILLKDDQRREDPLIDPVHVGKCSIALSQRAVRTAREQSLWHRQLRDRHPWRARASSSDPPSIRRALHVAVVLFPYPQGVVTGGRYRAARARMPSSVGTPIPRSSSSVRSRRQPASDTALSSAGRGTFIVPTRRRIPSPRSGWSSNQR
jgi:hypothetical protein